MNVDIKKTFTQIGNKLLPSVDLPLNVLHSIYSLDVKFRSQLIGIIYEKEYGTSGTKCRKLADTLTEGIFQNDTVTLTINEPLPSMKELTAAMHDHWLELIHTTIKKSSERQKSLYFDKAFVLIEITTPKYTDNAKLWDTSNRAINLVINNLKGAFFKDDNHEHMAFGVTGNWGEEGKTVVKIMPYERLERLN